MMIRYWAADRHAVVLLVTPKGELDRVIRNIRVTMAKEKHRISSKVHWGFVIGDSFPYTDCSVKGEAATLIWRQTNRQNLFHHFEQVSKTQGFKL